MVELLVVIVILAILIALLAAGDQRRHAHGQERRGLGRDQPAGPGAGLFQEQVR